jgi:hypothetical protein
MCLNFFLQKDSKKCNKKEEEEESVVKSMSHRGVPLQNEFMAFVWVFLFLFRASLLIYSLPTPFLILHLSMEKIYAKIHSHMMEKKCRVQSSRLSVEVFHKPVFISFSFHFSSSCLIFLFTYATICKRENV